MKIKESKKIDKYVDLAKEQKKLWRVQMTVTLIVVCVLATVPNWPRKDS